MFIKTFPVGAFQCNCSIIADETTGEAIIVDPGDEGPRIIEEVRKMNFKVKYLLHTHAHLDHIGATKEVHQELGGEICLHKGDEFLYENMAMQAQILGMSCDTDVLPVSKSVEHKDIVECSKDLRTEVLHTPGHTPGSICFFMKHFEHVDQNLSGPILFSGDTLFQRSIGRTDLWGGDHGQILSSIKDRLLTLPEKTLVIPGHGPVTQIGTECQENPFVGQNA